jgi:DNA mismatch repair ATPase MutS
MKLYGNLSRIVGEADTLSNLIYSLEQQVFTSDYLRSIQTKIQPPAGSAGKELKSLKSILGRFDLRLNTVLFLLLNSFLLWDVRQVKSLTAWKAKNRTLVPLWFSAIEEAEVMISLGILHFNQPHFIFPQFKDEYCLVAGSGIGHPLLHAEQRVTSDFSISGRGKIALITGSNMAGKSTFLRSLGVNLVLAQMGAPVCAQTFTLSPMKLMSSMRIADDLSENTSTFYAELKKLKSIIDEVNRQQPLLILLDEILRGTNSLDRHAGTKALIRQLIKQQAVAVLATHDVALAELSDDHSQAMENYHFDVQVANEDELYFDYKLKRGVCQSLNAAILMRKIGIELER